MTWQVRGDQLIYRPPAKVRRVDVTLKPPPPLASPAERALPAPSRIRVRDVQIAAAAVCGVPLSAMTSAVRIAPWVKARQIGMRVAVELTGRSVKFVGMCFGRDHTTVLHALRATEAPELRALCGQIAAEAAASAARFERSCSSPAFDAAPESVSGSRPPGGVKGQTSVPPADAEVRS